jgi:hypothetical protein
VGVATQPLRATRPYFRMQYPRSMLPVVLYATPAAELIRTFKMLG